MLGRLVKWLVTILFIVVVGTLIGWAIPVVIEAVPLLGFIVAFMVAAIVLFKAVVWYIKRGGW